MTDSRTTKELERHAALFERKYQYLRSEIENIKLDAARNDERRKQEIHVLIVQAKLKGIDRWNRRDKTTTLFAVPIQAFALLAAFLIAIASIKNAFF